VRTDACGTCEIYIPHRAVAPRGILHFIGGAALGAAPRSVYSLLLERIASLTNTIVITTPVSITLDHATLAESTARAFDDCRLNHLPLLLNNSINVFSLPVIGVGHSLGAKIHAILAADPQVRAAAGVRLANVLISYNNFPAETSIPLLTQLASSSSSRSSSSKSASGSGGGGDVGDVLRTASEIARAARGFSSVFDVMMNQKQQQQQSQSAASSWTAGFEEVGRQFGVFESIAGQLEELEELLRAADDGDRRLEFEPAPSELDKLIDEHYCVVNNLIVQFKGDRIDQSDALVNAIRRRFLPSLLSRPKSNTDTHNTTNDDGGGGGGGGENGAEDINPVVFRQLSGNHLTPATPRFDVDSVMRTVEQGLASNGGGGGAGDVVRRVIQSLAQSTSDQLEQLIIVSAAFITLQLELYEASLAPQKQLRPSNNET